MNPKGGPGPRSPEGKENQLNEIKEGKGGSVRSMAPMRAIPDAHPPQSFESGRVVFVLAFILILGLLMAKGAKITGLSFASEAPSPLEFVAPTPDNGSMVNLPWIIINISDQENLSLAVLSWGDQNISMQVSSNGFKGFNRSDGSAPGSTTTAWARVNGSGVFTYVVYTLNVNGSASSTVSRTVNLTYLNWSSIPEQLLQEDSRLDMDIWTRLQSAKSKSLVGFSVLQDRTDRVVCSLDQARFLNCTSVPDAVGATSLIISADDGIAAVSIPFNVSILQVNDPPRFVNSIAGTSLRPGEVWDLDLAPLVYDPESDPILLTVEGADAIPLKWISSTKLRFSPNATSVGVYNVSIIANDSKNSSSSNSFSISVKQNLPPQVITKLSVLVLNNTRAYSLKFYQIFEDPDGDDLTFSFENVSIARIIRRGNTLYIVPYENKTGSENLKLGASDGQFSSSYSLPLLLVAGEHPVQPSAPQTISSSGSGIQSPEIKPAPSPVSPSQVLPSQVSPEDLPDAGPPFSPNAQPGNNQPGDVNVEAGNNSQIKAPAISEGPVLVKPLPALIFDENTTNITINLEEYWHDPSGKGLEFLIEPKSPFVTKMQSRNIAIISLSSPGQKVSNDTVKILAKDASGNVVTGRVLVSVSSAVFRHQDKIDAVLMAAIALTLIIIAGMLSVRFLPVLLNAQGQLRRGGDGREASTKNSQTSQPFRTSRASKSGNAAGGGQFKAAMRDTWSDISSRFSSTFSSPFSSPFSSNFSSPFSSSKRLDEPIELKSAAMLLREAHAILKIIISSADDQLVQAALEREEEKIARALNLMRGKAELSSSDMKRILLYIKEASVCISKIIEIAEDPLIIGELTREADRLDNVAKLIEVKLVYTLDVSSIT